MLFQYFNNVFSDISFLLFNLRPLQIYQAIVCNIMLVGHMYSIYGIWANAFLPLIEKKMGLDLQIFP